VHTHAFNGNPHTNPAGPHTHTFKGNPVVTKPYTTSIPPYMIKTKTILQV
jgi:hypothetical protein